MLFVLLAGYAVAPGGARAQDTVIEVQADRVEHPVPHCLTGACIEDVNHEIYGGIYSQMVFGEYFQEPCGGVLRGFATLGGRWRVENGELSCSGAPGDKLVSELAPFADGAAGVEVYVPESGCTNAGLIVRVGNARKGMDAFDGYEISLNGDGQSVRLGRHRHNWELLKDSPCEVPGGRWVSLIVKMTGPSIEVRVDGKSVLRYDDGGGALPAGTVGLRQFQPEARYRNLWVKTNGETRTLPFAEDAGAESEVSGMWRPVQTGSASGKMFLESDRPFAGRQSQRITFAGGAGCLGVENKGLNRWGMSFAADKPYEGVLWVRAEAPAAVCVALENGDGTQTLAEERLAVTAGDWQRLSFTLAPAAAANPGRFAVTLREPGSVVLGYAFLQPGDWGRFKGLPVRRDVADALIDQGITVLRYGGSMINHPGYRWKKMIGPRDRREPCQGTWYPYSSNGWGIPDFMNLCEAAGFEYVPAFNMGESPRDMADFIEYAKGPAESEWGRRRISDGHPEPYRLKYLELGNEERVDEAYYQKFRPLAETIWARDPDIILVVGDFAYGKPIVDPFKVQGAAAGITTLAAQQQILQLAREHNREVWFDVHVGTEGPRPDFGGTFSYIDTLQKLSEGAKHRVVIFEFNSGNHSQRRALANAAAINMVERDGRIPIAISANCLQPDGQNDNDWDQGLLFLNPAQVWLQPPGFVAQMFSRNYLPNSVSCRVSGANDALDVSAKRSDDGRVLSIQAVNPTDNPVTAELHLAGFVPETPFVRVAELAGELDAVNTAARPDAIVPQQRGWKHGLADGKTGYTFPPRSVTVMSWK